MGYSRLMDGQHEFATQSNVLEARGSALFLLIQTAEHKQTEGLENTADSITAQARSLHRG